MAQYWTCPDCGANLDPGEPCDCKKHSVENKEDKKDVGNNNSCNRTGKTG